MTSFHIIIPARYASARLPGKVLMHIGDKTILQLVYEKALASQAESVTIATDHEIVYETAAQFSDCVLMTSEHHLSGTDRLAEVVQSEKYQNSDCIVNVQGDEPLIDPILINQVANNLMSDRYDMATLCWPIESRTQLASPNIVKVVRNHLNQALYFSRQPIPYQAEPDLHPNRYFRHIGLYAYRASFLRAWQTLQPCLLERQEKLEQLRALWYGHAIHVDIAKVMPMQDVNCAEDLAMVRRLIQCQETG